MKVEVIQSVQNMHHLIATLEMEPSELPRVGEYISVERTKADQKTWPGLESIGRYIKNVSRHFNEGKIDSATIEVG